MPGENIQARAGCLREQSIGKCRCNKKIEWITNKGEIAICGSGAGGEDGGSDVKQYMGAVKSPGGFRIAIRIRQGSDRSAGIQAHAQIEHIGDKSQDGIICIAADEVEISTIKRISARVKAAFDIN